MEKEQLRPRIPPEARKKKAGGEVLAQSASEYIEAHYTEKFSLQKMADSLYVNGSYLLRVFKMYKGYNVIDEMVFDVIIEVAKTYFENLDKY